MEYNLACGIAGALVILPVAFVPAMITRLASAPEISNAKNIRYDIIRENRLGKILKKAQAISPIVTMSDIESILEFGFAFDFCKGKRLASSREIELFVLGQIRQGIY